MVTWRLTPTHLFKVDHSNTRWGRSRNLQTTPGKTKYNPEVALISQSIWMMEKRQNQ